MLDKQIDAFDILAFFSFFMGLTNYDNLIKQRDVQDLVSNAVNDIHSHLKSQDKKIDSILVKLGGENNEG